MSTPVNLLSTVSAARDGRNGSFGPISCHVVGYHADQSAPFKFTYEACSFRNDKGRMLARSQRRGITCHPGSKSIVTYRFEIALCDGTRDGLPLRVKVFEAGLDLFGISAFDFNEWSPEEQEAFVKDFCNSYLRLVVCQTLVASKLERPQSLSSIHAGQHSLFHSSASTSRNIRHPAAFEQWKDFRKSLADVYEGLPTESLNSDAVRASAGKSQQSPRRSPDRVAAVRNVSLDLEHMERKDIQSLCKQLKLPANKSTIVMKEALRQVLAKENASTIVFENCRSNA